MDRIRRKWKHVETLLGTSAFTVGEVLNGPYRSIAIDTASRIREAFRSPQNRTDSIYTAGVDLFPTNDRRLQPSDIPGIHFIAGLDVNLF
jgi:hypothetical protein